MIHTAGVPTLKISTEVSWPRQAAATAADVLMMLLKGIVHAKNKHLLEMYSTLPTAIQEAEFGTELREI